MSWQYRGGEERGRIVREQESYECWLEDGFVHVRLPFAVDRERLRELLTKDFWAVGLDFERADSLGWGEAYDVEGYYPYWVYPEKTGRESPTLFAFPPKDYRMEDQPGLVAGPESARGDRIPIIASNTLEEFAHWIPYLKIARK